MKHHLTSLLLLTLLLLVTSSCTKGPEPSLPPITQEGKNTLGFKADGQVWVNRGKVCNLFTCIDNEVAGSLNKNNDGTTSIIVSAYYTNKDKNINQNLTLSAKGANATGTYTLTLANGSFMSYMVNSVADDFYILGSNSNATLTVTKLDIVNNIISGQFSAVLYSYKDPSKTVTITDGRFDTKLTYTE